MRASLVLFGALAFLSGSQAQADCNCGYFDPSTGNVFTEYLIAYFNETSSIPSETFSVQTYQNPYEKAWNAIYRTGANESNVEIVPTHPTSFWNANKSLALSVDPASPHHLVTGGSIRSLRADMLYGSFRTLVKPASNQSAGIAVSMFLQFNDTQNIRISTSNTDEPDTAWFTMTTGDEFSDRDLGVNFTATGSNGTNQTLYGGISPWDYTELRIDWNEKNVSYYIGDSIARVATYKEKTPKGFPSTPSELILRAWSNGDPYYMMGPPENHRTTGYIGYTRAFFNSSIWTKENHTQFDSRCHLADACSMDDFSLRGYSPFTHESTLSYVWHHSPSLVRKFAVIVISSSVALTLILACNILYQRWPKKETKENEKEKYCRRLPPQLASSGCNSDTATAISSPAGSSRTSSFEFHKDSKDIDDMKITEIGPSRFGSSANLMNQQGSTSVFSSKSPTRVGSSTTLNALSLSQATSSLTLNNFPTPKMDSTMNFSMPTGQEEEKKPAEIQVTEKEVESRPAGPAHAVTTNSLAKPYKPLQPRQRIDFLAGLISIVTIFVSLEHFMFTFVPAVAMPGAPYHYKSEVWADTIIGTFIFNQIYLGVFFITSTRFLISKFVKTGKLDAIAEKVTGRVFRVWVPIAASAMLEYFLIDCGATKWLMYLPSVTWSTWPYTVGYTDFSNYISELIELVYLIPNAAPKITFNYCTGVLWTIPVQIQGSWVSLAGAVLVYEIKNPWKRAGYYAFCVINNWYAQSWGSFFWLGVMLTDLDVTFKYKTWFKSHRLVYYSLMSLAVVLAIGGLIQDGVTRWTGFSMPVIENDIHPDITSGKTIEAAGLGGYPDYVTPRLNGLLFAIGLQFIVENCHWVQVFLSAKPFLMVFPHIFTIYLFHGLIFWSLGAVICTHLGSLSYVPYWAAILVTAVSCYGTLFAMLPILTPIVETLGKDVTANIWSWAHIEPAPKRRTLFPFREDLFFEQVRDGDNSVTEQEDDVEKKGSKVYMESIREL